MFKFKNEDNNKEFISISIKDINSTRKVYEYIKQIYPVVEKGLYGIDEQEILLSVGKVKYNFSLNELDKTVSRIAVADVYYFHVDAGSLNSQRKNVLRADGNPVRHSEVECTKTKKNLNSPSSISLKPSGDVKTRGEWADSILQNAFSIGGKTIAYVPVSLLNIQPYQRDKQKHIMKIAENWGDSKCTVLLVSYDNNKKQFNVMDGQHRALAAKMRGIKYLVCEIFTGLNLSTEALKFVDSNVNAKS